jgi:hypothetical protein
MVYVVLLSLLYKYELNSINSKETKHALLSLVHSSSDASEIPGA